MAHGSSTTASPVYPSGIATPGGRFISSDFIVYANSTTQVVADDGGNETRCFSGSPDCVWLFYGHYSDLTQLASVHTIFVALFLLIMAFGMAGNAMVIGVVWSHRSMRTPTNFYIVSLAVSDLLVITFVMPLKLVEYGADIDYSIFNTVLCSFTAFVMPAFIFTSIWTLVAISVDRYLVIIHPLKARSFNTRSRALRTIGIIWFAPFVLLSPYFYPYQTLRYYFHSNMGTIRRLVCTDRFSDFGKVFGICYNLFLFGILFVIPVFLLGFSCGSIAKRLMSLTEDEKMLKNSVRKEEASRRKVAKMVLVVVLCFFLCWCPFFIVSVTANFSHLLHKRNYMFSLLLIHLLAFANSFMNPVIYALMSQAFRSGFWEILTICCPQYRDLVAPSRHHGERRSVTAVSQTEVAPERSTHAKRGYNRFVRRESTQFSAVSDQDEDHIGMTKLSKSGNNSNNNNRKPVASRPNQPGPDAERKRRAERLLHKFLDEEPPEKSSDTDGITKEDNECETPLIGNDEQEYQKQNGPSGMLLNTGAVCRSNDPDENAVRVVSETSHDMETGTPTGAQTRAPETNPELIRLSVGESTSPAWKSANDTTSHERADLGVHEGDTEANAHFSSNIPEIAIHSTSTTDVEQLMDCEQGTT
ncbi:uncharacterized protein [Diadema antillarum]|uniref:uncharacterized protein n=1 Tax=Diadema antillarum TaxID=105358 RepID=UPI003A89A3F1